MLKETRDTKQ